MALPLDGTLIVDLTQNVAGPFCTQILGDMGADVVKVERPGHGDEARAWAPPYWGDESSKMNRATACEMATARSACSSASP